MRITQVYAPYFNAEDEIYEKFLDDLANALNGHGSTYDFIIGNFNATVGPRETSEN